MDENLEPEKTKEEILAQFEERDGKYIYKLKEPIQFGSETITEFELQRPKAKHIRNMPMKPTMGDMIDVVGKLAAQPKKVVDELSQDDLMICVEFYGAFS